MLRRQWTVHKSAWKAPPAELSQGDVLDYWQGFAKRFPELGQLAVHHWLRPISSAACERVISHLTNMDTDQRQNMSMNVVHDVLFLRANWRVVQELVDGQYAGYVRATMAEEGERMERSVRAVEKKQRMEAGASASLEATYARAAASAGAASASAGGAESDGEAEFDPSKDS